MRWAMPSTIAVFPTPGSPMSTRLFLVLRERTCMTRRISSSRPITGSILPRRAASVRSLCTSRAPGTCLRGRDRSRADCHARCAERLEQLLVVEAGFVEQSLKVFVGAGAGQQEMLGGDVIILERLGFVLGLLPGRQPRRERLRSAPPLTRG